jgi:tetratricopeptide (TPR) repeat protein
MVRQGRLPEVRRHLARPGVTTADPEVKRATAALAYREGRFDEAAELYRALLEAHDDPADAVALGRSLFQAGQFGVAAEAYRVWARRWPGSAIFLCGLGDCLDAIGEVEEARRALREAVEIDRDSGGAWYRLTALGDYNWLHGRRQRLLAPANPERNLPDRYAKEFAAGRYLEKQGQWDEAFRRLSRGNELRRNEQQYDFRRKIDVARLVMEDWEGQDWAEAPPAHESRAPIFVVGMPRSGTSLVEQILDSHPEVRGISESSALRQEIARTLRGSREPISKLDWRPAANRYLERVGPLVGDARRFVDKMVFNFNSIGFIRHMFPNACIIHCRRDPLDTCISCFRTNFDRPELSYNLTELGWFFGYYEGMMAFWQEHFPDAIIEVNYEQLVHDPRRRIARLLEALGLPWSERCLEFHKNPRQVWTASKYQVQEPVHTTSIGRAEPYRGHLAPLEEAIEEARGWMRRDAG